MKKTLLNFKVFSRPQASNFNHFSLLHRSTDTGVSFLSMSGRFSPPVSIKGCRAGLCLRRKVRGRRGWRFRKTARFFGQRETLIGFFAWRFRIQARRFGFYETVPVKKTKKFRISDEITLLYETFFSFMVGSFSWSAHNRIPVRPRPGHNPIITRSWLNQGLRVRFVSYFRHFHAALRNAPAVFNSSPL